MTVETWLLNYGCFNILSKANDWRQAAVSIGAMKTVVYPLEALQQGLSMDNMIGKRILISGMAIEVLADAEESWECLNVTTKETVFIKKSVLSDAIKLGKAELLAEPGDV